MVENAALVDTVGESWYAVDTLDLGATYYWKVNEVNTVNVVNSWEGPVWSFTTQDSHVVDDFEGYDDNQDAGLAMWQTWADGYDATDNGSQVGHIPAPYAERSRIRRGRQSMPFYYYNSGAILRSEAVRTFEEPQDWTRGGAAALVLYFYGDAENTFGRMYVKVNDAMVLYDGAATDLAKPFWIQWTIDLAAIGTNVKDVRTMTVGVDNGGFGMLLFDDIRLYRSAPEQATEEIWIEAEAADSMVCPMRRYSDRADAWGGQYIATFGDTSTGNPPDNGVAGYTVIQFGDRLSRGRRTARCLDDHPAASVGRSGANADFDYGMLESRSVGMMGGIRWEV